MDSTKRSLIREKLNEAFAELEKELDVKFSLGNFAYSDSIAKAKITVTEKNSDGSVTPQMESDFMAFAGSVGLEPSDFGKEFQNNGKTFTVCGLKPRNTKFPVIASCGDKKYKFTALDVDVYLRRKNGEVK